LVKVTQFNNPINLFKGGNQDVQLSLQSCSNNETAPSPFFNTDVHYLELNKPY
jgi:hypothetical protein